MSDTKLENIETTEPVAASTLPEKEGEVSELAKGDSPDFKWYIAHVLSGYENRVKKTLKERVLSHKLMEYFSEIHVPEEEHQISSTTGAKTKKKTIKKKSFPGYLLVKMIMNEHTWRLVQETDKITGFLGGVKGQPSPISDQEAAYMTGKGADGPKRANAHLSFSEGDSVRVIEGPFTSFVGTIEQVGDKGKIKVQVSIFGRQTSVELDFSKIEKV